MSDKISLLLDLISSIFLCFAATTNLVQAQVTSDETLSTKVNTSNNLDFNITNGDQLGGNLFHSFLQFSVPEGGSANFANGLDVQNIFSRVTGSSISEINGLIKTNGSANLFLLNPNGIIFGSNAQLNVGGSFIATTASQINFDDGKTFSTRDRQTEPLLTVSIPIGLQFGENPGDIINRSIVNNGLGLEVLSDKTLALIGGDLFLEGGVLTTIGGRIELGSVASQAFVSLTPFDTGWALGYDNVREFQDIQLSAKAVVQTELLDKGRGDILLQGRNILVSGNSEISSFNLSEVSGGRITVKASESVEIAEDSELLTASFFIGASADIIIETKRLVVRDKGSFLDTSTDGDGRGGNLTINATESVEIDAAGGLNQLTTQTFGKGDAGDLRINTRKLTLRNGGQLSSSTENVGNGGQVIINALESIEVSGQGILGNRIVDSGILAQTRDNEAKGDAGNISINTGRLSIRDGGTISVAAVEGSTGRAGNLEINANSLSLNQGSITAETAQTGGEEGASISLKISDLLTLENESLISATANGLADGGNVDIDAGFVIAFPNQNNDIIARASQGNGGNIEIITQGIFGIEERSSTPPNQTNDLDASSQFGLDGTIIINQPEVNPAETLGELPTEVIDVTRLVAQNLCQQFKGSEFIITGKGGIAPNPSEVRDGEVVEVDLVEPALFGEDRGDRGDKGDEGEIIVEAQGWIINNRGNVELVAHKTDLNGSLAQPKDDRICTQ